MTVDYDDAPDDFADPFTDKGIFAKRAMASCQGARLTGAVADNAGCGRAPCGRRPIATVRRSARPAAAACRKRYGTGSEIHGLENEPENIDCPDRLTIPRAGRLMKKVLALVFLASLAACASDKVNHEPYLVARKKTYPSLVMAPPACKLAENRYAGFCSSYNYLETITAPPKF
jgi:hypothetical protein